MQNNDAFFPVEFLKLEGTLYDENSQRICVDVDD